MLSILVALQSAAAVGPAPANPPMIDDDGTITVTSTYLPDLADAEARCRQAQCPVRQDVAATVAYASKLFEDGSYVRAKRVLVAGINRVKNRAGDAPLAVAQLYAATAKLAEHEGDSELTRTSYERGIVLLRANLPADDDTRLATEIRYGDWLLSSWRGSRQAARDHYNIAAKSGNARARAAAELRLAQMFAAGNERGRADRSLKAIADTGDGDIRLAALAVRGRLADAAGNHKVANAVASELREVVSDIPLLISSPRLPGPGQLPAQGSGDAFWGGGTPGFMLPPHTLSWVDIAYQINPDGSVSDVNIVRGSEARLWAKPILAYISGQRYTRTALGRQRVERYTYTADWGLPPGSLIQRRLINPRFVAAELSDAPAFDDAVGGER